jgi:adenosine deaminase
MEDHNLKRLLDLGLCVTVNSDDPAYFGGYMNENYLAAQKALDLDLEDIRHLAQNAIQASFISQLEKQGLLDELEDYFERTDLKH